VTSASDRYACYEAALALQRPDGSYSNDALRQVGAAYGVALSTIRRWLSKGFPERGDSRRFVPAHEDYVAVAEHLSIRAAHDARKDAVGVSYSTYHRGFTELGDRGLLRAALEGYTGLVNNGLYLQGRPLHRNHTWAYDHFEVPAWVTVPRRVAPIKPWATLVTDTFSRAILALLLIVGKPTAETVAAPSSRPPTDASTTAFRSTGCRCRSPTTTPWRTSAKQLGWASPDWASSGYPSTHARRGRTATPSRRST
jgi:hypothetical protein